MGAGGTPVKIFVISLETAVERCRHMTALLAGIGVEAVFFPAVDGRRLSDEQRSRYNVRQARRIYGCEMTDSEIGCYLSHYAIYEKMSEENIEAALILEDDIDCVVDLKAVVEQLLRQDGWQVVRLMSSRGKIASPRTGRDYGAALSKVGQRDLCRLDRGVLGGCAYLMRRSAAQAMLRYGRSIFMPIDQTLDRFWENGIVPFVLRPLPVWHRDDFQSEIGSRGREVASPLSRSELFVRRMQRFADGINKRVFWLAYRAPILGASLSRMGWRSAHVARAALAGSYFL